MSEEQATNEYAAGEEAATILLIGDDPGQLELTAALLGKAGYRVLTAGGAAEGVGAALRVRPDLVICDVVMPGGGGADVIRRLRREPATAATPVLLVSAVPEGGAVTAAGLRAGADAFLKLPYDPPRLLATAARLIERASAARRLGESEERFRLLVEGVKDYAIFMTDPAGVIVSWNEGVRRVLRYEEGEFVGLPVAAIFTPEDAAAGMHTLEMETALAEGRADDERWHVRKGGELFWATGTVTPLRDEAGRLRGFAKVMRDNTEGKLAAAERERLLASEQGARAEAEEANRLKDQFLATLSHELRTPLTSILGWARMLRSGTLPAEMSARALEAVERNAQTQKQLIDDLLDVSRIITGKLHMEMRPVSMVSVVDAAVETVRPAAEARNIRLQVLAETGTGTITGDSDRLQQVVWNLLSNAIKFTPEGGEVSVRLERAESTVRLRVSDTGRGIRPEFLPYVFDRFRQADASASRRMGGLGLGLAIVRHIVEAHGGAVEAESAGEGRGATFTVTLPVLPAERPAGARPNVGATSGVSCPPAIDGLRVLVVDDDPDALDYVAAVLEHCGASVRRASTVAEALGAFRQEPPDVLVSDIGLPGQDGYELMRKVRKLPRRRGGRVPAVALTAYAREEDRLEAYRAGFQMHLSKPVTPDDLLTVVANLVQGEDGE